MNHVSRRRFLKITGAGAWPRRRGGSASASLPGGLRAAEGPGREGVRTVPTFCDLCFWKCNAIATVRDGVLWKIEGNPDDPLSPRPPLPARHRRRRRPLRPRPPARARSSARACAARRSGPRSPGTRRSATSPRRCRRSRPSTARRRSPSSATASAATFLKHTLKAYGSPNVAAPSFAQCRGPRDVGFELTFGEAIGSPERTDIRERPLPRAHRLAPRREHAQHAGAGVRRGGRPRRDGHRGRPALLDRGEQGEALPADQRRGPTSRSLLAWMNVLVAEGLYDRSTSPRTASASRRSPPRSRPSPRSGRTRRPASSRRVIRETAREMARHRPATLVHPGRHATWYGDDAQRGRAIALLNALLGSWGRKGGFYQPASMNVPGYPYPPYPKSARGKVDNPGRRTRSRARRSPPASARPRSPASRIRSRAGWCTRRTCCRRCRTRRRRSGDPELDLLVVVDVVASEMAGWADVVLPESTYLERYDELNVELFREPFVALRQPVVEAPADQKPNWWIARELAVKLGLGAFYPWKTIEEYLDHRLKGAGLSLAAAQEGGRRARRASRPSTTRTASRPTSRRPRRRSSSTRSS